MKAPCFHRSWNVVAGPTVDKAVGSAVAVGAGWVANTGVSSPGTHSGEEALLGNPRALKSGTGVSSRAASGWDDLPS